MKELSLKELQGCCLEILKDVDAFCRTNEINYSLAYGSLLGAVRHKGFIPWDDDLDIVMPRKDYERFCREYRSGNFRLICQDNTPDCFIPFARVTDFTRTESRTYAPWMGSMQNPGVWIDVFPLDYAPDDESENLAVYKLSRVILEYNNKLRKLEISNRLPPIVNAYLKQLRTQRIILWSIVILAALLAVGAFLLYLLSRRRNAQLHLSQKRLEHKNTQLNAVNNQLQTMNGELSRVNGLLVEANKKREKYLRLFVDICASTMDRINSYRNLVRLKIKAKQTDDLLRTVNSDRIVSRDMAQFYVQFDKAFLGLYPHFVDDFTKLLQPDYQVSLNKDGSLTTELRIFAFIRLGVTESSEIATLLSYSPHTIYNYRSAMKSHAIDKEHFEENVKNL